MDCNIHIVLGGTGSGKTTFVTGMGHIMYDDDYLLCSNYTLYDIEYYKIDDFTDLLSIEGDKLCFLLDEWWITADARRSNAIGVLNSRKFANQHRKKHAHVWITSQRGKGQLELTYMNLCKEFYEPEIALDDENGKPILLDVDYKFLIRGKEYKGSFPFPCQIETQHGFIDIPEHFNTDEIIDESTINIKKEYENIIKKYVPLAGDMKKNELKSMLEIEENIPSSMAETVNNYIYAMYRLATITD